MTKYLTRTQRAMSTTVMNGMPITAAPKQIAHRTHLFFNTGPGGPAEAAGLSCRVSGNDCSVAVFINSPKSLMTVALAAHQQRSGGQACCLSRMLQPKRTANCLRMHCRRRLSGAGRMTVTISYNERHVLGNSLTRTESNRLTARNRRASGHPDGPRRNERTEP